MEQGHLIAFRPDHAIARDVRAGVDAHDDALAAVLCGGGVPLQVKVGIFLRMAPAREKCGNDLVRRKKGESLSMALLGTAEWCDY
jgi:hypothetical protein